MGNERDWATSWPWPPRCDRTAGTPPFWAESARRRWPAAPRWPTAFAATASARACPITLPSTPARACQVTTTAKKRTQLDDSPPYSLKDGTVKMMPHRVETYLITYLFPMISKDRYLVLKNLFFNCFFCQYCLISNANFIGLIHIPCS